MRRLRAVWRIARWPALVAAVAGVLLVLPVAYIEVACRDDTGAESYRPLITGANARREANTYLTYPEWHIVFAYDGMAEALRTGEAHAFPYVRSIRGFWRSACALMQVADAHGGADGATRVMIHTIGVSFTAEMIAKGAYEETIGRLAAWIRGPETISQDKVIAATAVEYAAFLRHTPWYRFPFLREARELWSPRAGLSLRAWERRVGVGLEYVGKAGYATVLGWAAGASPAALTIRSIVSGLAPAELESIPDVTVVGTRADGVEIETPRYAAFTRVLAQIARRGGGVREIAGNDDVMVTITAPAGADPGLKYGNVITRMPRDGFRGDRLLVTVTVADLAPLLRAHPLGDPGVEHVFDY